MGTSTLPIISLQVLKVLGVPDQQLHFGAAPVVLLEDPATPPPFIIGNSTKHFHNHPRHQLSLP
jgi:hypothetical protein